MDHSRWLALEALLPLFGAAVLFLIWGGVRYIVNGAQAFTYHWRQAYDPLGWLYGGAVLAFQAGTKAYGHPNAGSLPIYCYGSAAVCLLFLIAAMSERGQSTSWSPPRLFTGVSVLLVLAILVASYNVQALVAPIASPIGSAK
jgi:hypothetical protein